MFKLILTELIALIPLITPLLRTVINLFKKDKVDPPVPEPTPIPPVVPPPPVVVPVPIPSPEPVPYPPPDKEITASDYMAREKAGNWEEEYSTGEAAELYSRLQECWWAGHKDMIYVASNCPDSCLGGRESLFTLTVGQMIDASKVGYALVKEADRFIQHWNEENPNFPGRTRIRKQFYAEYNGRLKSHLLLANEQRAALAGLTGTGQLFDSIGGYCEWKHREG